MIISHRHRFIFVKTQKTAGTSMEISLSRYCGPEDIISPISFEDELVRGSYGMSCQNYQTRESRSGRSIVNRPARRTLVKWLSRWEAKWPHSLSTKLMNRIANRPIGSDYKQTGFYNHMPVEQIIDRIGQDVWNSYYSFCFERDPVAKCVSWYRYHTTNVSFDDSLSSPRLPTDFGVYSLGGNVAVDFVGRFEAMKEDLTTALRNVGIEFDGWLPHVKNSTGKRQMSVADVTHSQRRRIREIFANEYGHFSFD